MEYMRKVIYLKKRGLCPAGEEGEQPLTVSIHARYHTSGGKSGIHSLQAGGGRQSVSGRDNRTVRHLELPKPSGGSAGAVEFRGDMRHIGWKEGVLSVGDVPGIFRCPVI